MNTMKPSEYLSSDILEEDYLKSFSPFRSVQMLLGSCRVDARHRFVTPPTKLQKIYTIIVLIINLACYINVVIYYFPRFSEYPNIYYLKLCTFYLHWIIYACNIINSRFINNDINAKFYIRMQEIDRKLKIDNNNFINGFLYKINLMTVVIISFVSIILFSISLTEGLLIFVTFTGPFYAQATCTLEWLYCSNLIIYFYIRLRYINAIMTNYVKGPAETKIKLSKYNIFPTMKRLRHVAADIHDFRSSDIDVYLKDIFEELFRFQILYRFQIFLFCFNFVTSTLMTFEFGLLALQKNILELFECIILPSVTAIDLAIIIVLCVRCEAFFREIKTTKCLCIKILSLNYSGPIRGKAIKMLKMIKEKPPQLSIYDMWYIEASTMINMINLVTTLMVALLQFALL